MARHRATRTRTTKCDTPEQRHLSLVRSALDRGDYDALRRLAYLSHGFGSGELRRSVWLFLLGVPQHHSRDGRWRELVHECDPEHKDLVVMRADVARSVYTWDVHVGVRKELRTRKRAELYDVMRAAMQKHRNCCNYFQGFHDVALVFLECGTSSQAFHMVERFGVYHMSDQFCWPLDQGLLPLLAVLFFLIECLDAPVARALLESDCAELHFAIPWVMTWFAHSLPRLHQVMRLFDCLLSSHPAMILYFCAVPLLEVREQILETPRDMAEMMMVLQRLPLGKKSVDDWAIEAQSLAQQLSPEDLMRRLPPDVRRALPSSSPLIHFPHPWMKNSALAKRGDLSKLAPAYSSKLGNRAQSWIRSSSMQTLLVIFESHLRSAVGGGRSLRVFGSGGALTLAGIFGALMVRRWNF